MQSPKGWMILWIVGTVGGWLLGCALSLLTLWFYKLVDQSFASWQPYAEVIIIALYLGLGVGIVQWYIALKEMVTRFTWVTATVAAGILVVASVIVDSFRPLFRVFREFRGRPQIW